MLTVTQILIKHIDPVLLKDKKIVELRLLYTQLDLNKTVCHDVCVSAGCLKNCLDQCLNMSFYKAATLSAFNCFERSHYM